CCVHVPYSHAQCQWYFFTCTFYKPFYKLKSKTVLKVHREPGLYPGELWAQGRGLLGWDANSSEGTVAHTLSTDMAIWKSSYNIGTTLGTGGRNPGRTGRTYNLHAHWVEAGFEPPALDVQGKCANQ
ncbi:hypothetical protein AMELA_G00246380, partial [Ameiurus melas]